MPPLEVCYFVDRSLGRSVVPERLREAGFTVEVHDDRFQQDTEDVDWLSHAGAQGWVVLTKDARIRTNEIERRCLLDAGVAAFILGRGDMSGEAVAQCFIDARRGMDRALRRFDRPFIASVSSSAVVTMLWNAKGRMKPPLVIKGR